MVAHSSVPFRRLRDMTSLRVRLVRGPVAPGADGSGSAEAVSNAREFLLEARDGGQQRLRDLRVVTLQFAPAVVERRKGELQACFAMDEARLEQSVAQRQR